VQLGLLAAKVGLTEEEGGLNYQLIELTAPKPFNSVAEIEFLDSKGSVIECRFSGSGNFSGDCKETYLQAYLVNSGRSR